MRLALTPGFEMAGAPAQPRTATAYRADIDGLRALAVVVVVLYHAQPSIAPGGFIGVDVFFVISGYLITQLLDREIRENRFSLLDFYERRVRRIFPALFAMLAVTTMIATIILIPSDLKAFGRNAVGAAAFVSNFFLSMQGSYFEGAEARPLLHTWSLAIEEQFYLFFPLVLAALRRGWPNQVAPVLGGIALCSFVASVLALSAAPTAAFYLPQYRTWELLGGSLIALGVLPAWPNAIFRELGGALGLCLLLTATYAFSEATPFPGPAALLPCLGTMLIIHAGTGGQTKVGRVLGTRPMVAVGLISYSVYLWHWPLIVFFTYYNIDHPTLPESLALIALSFTLGALSWRYVERPFRQSSSPSSRAGSHMLTGAGCAIATIIVAGSAIYLGRGFPQRFPTTVHALSGYALSQNALADECASTDLQLMRESPCTIGSDKTPSLFLWGDSHAGALFGALQDIAHAGGPSTVYGATPRCPPLLGMGTDATCIAGNQQRLEYVLAHPEISTVILAARWALYSRGRATRYGPAETNASLPVLEDSQGRQYPQFTIEARRGLRRGLYALVDKLLAAGKHVVVVYPVPEMGYDIPSTMARLAAEGRMPKVFAVPEKSFLYRQRFSFVLLDGLRNHRNLTRVYPDRALCPSDHCLGFINGTPLYFDSHHLSIPGSQRLKPALNSILRDSARP